MRKFDVHIEPSVAEELAKLPARLARRVRNVLHLLEREEAMGCPLGEGLEGLHLYRGERFVLVYRREQARVRVEALKIEPLVARDGIKLAPTRPLALTKEGVS